MVHPSSFDEFEEALTVFWRNRREQNELIHKRRNQVERGKLLYFDCGSHRGKLEGLEVPDHFTPGSFHALADAEEVGWHPEYKKELCSYNKKRMKGSEDVKVLTKEVNAVQNPALGAVLLWRFACGYRSGNERSEPAPLPLMFLVLPVLLDEGYSEMLAGTQGRSGLRAFVAKFSDARVSRAT